MKARAPPIRTTPKGPLPAGGRGPFTPGQDPYSGIEHATKPPRKKAHSKSKKQMNDSEVRIVDELKASDVLAFNFQDAARVIGLSYGSLRNEMIRGHIRPLDCQYKLVSRDELIRWITDREHKPTARKRAEWIHVPSAPEVA